MRTPKSHPIHQKSCCVLHGCNATGPRIKDPKCPVYSERIFQDKPCDACETQRIGVDLNPGNAIVEALAIKKGWIKACSNCGEPDRKSGRYWIVTHRIPHQSEIGFYKLESPQAPTIEQINAYSFPGQKINELRKDEINIAEVSLAMYRAVPAAWIRP